MREGVNTYFEGSDHETWEQEYLANIHPERDVLSQLAGTSGAIDDDDSWGLELDHPDEREIAQLANSEVDGFDDIFFDEMR